MLISWGKTGHYRIGHSVSLFLNSEMLQFSHWPALLAGHGSDADYRKGNDPEEGPKHYIDLDNYPEFNSTGRIPSTLDSIYAVHHPNFVKSQGYLPWATLTAYDSLRACFERRDWDKAVLFAADMGHYVGDGHMPLHLTRNYNGQFTGNDGIHSRYESDMINAYSSEIIFGGDSISFIGDVTKYIFDYIYQNYTFVDSVISADDYADSLAGNTWSSTYRAALWEKTSGFTIMLFRQSSRSLSELIYTAWVEAGRPSMYPSSIEGQTMIDEYGAGNRISLARNYPNPFKYSTQIRYTGDGRSEIKLQVIDASGRLVAELAEGTPGEGSHSLEWSPAGQGAGVYYLVLSWKEGVEVREMIYQPD